MAAKKKKKKKKLHNGFVFLLTLALTIGIGVIILLGYWALAGGFDRAGEEEPDRGETLETSADSQAWAPVAETAIQETTTPEPETTAADSRYGALLADPERCLEENVFARQTADPGEISFVFAGDILFDDQ